MYYYPDFLPGATSTSYTHESCQVLAPSQPMEQAQNCITIRSLLRLSLYPKTDIRLFSASQKNLRRLSSRSIPFHTSCVSAHRTVQRYANVNCECSISTEKAGNLEWYDEATVQYCRNRTLHQDATLSMTVSPSIRALNMSDLRLLVHHFNVNHPLSIGARVRSNKFTVFLVSHDINYSRHADCQLSKATAIR